MIWMGAVEFGLAALCALAAQVHLKEGLFARKLAWKSMQVMSIISVVLIAGVLGL
jgi:hypothetical protein